MLFDSKAGKTTRVLKKAVLVFVQKRKPRLVATERGYKAEEKRKESALLCDLIFRRIRMNKKRRVQIQEVIAKIDDISSLLQGILDDEQEAFENMPEGLQSSENGMVSEEAQGSLEAAIEALEESIVCLEEI